MKLKSIMITATIAIGLLACADKDASTKPAQNAGENTVETKNVEAQNVENAVTNTSADQIAKGEKLYVLCQACHAIDANAARKIGPHLQSIMQRDIAALEGFAYSPALKKIEGKWDEASMDEWLRSPQKMAPGNMMAFMGIPDAEARAALIAYLKTL